MYTPSSRSQPHWTAHLGVYTDRLHRRHASQTIAATAKHHYYRQQTDNRQLTNTTLQTEEEERRLGRIETEEEEKTNDDGFTINDDGAPQCTKISPSPPLGLWSS